MRNKRARAIRVEVAARLADEEMPRTIEEAYRRSRRAYQDAKRTYTRKK